MSKKGFKKLEEHEMKSFDSGSETELYLGPSAASTRSGGWYSWCLLLYMVLLTVLILMLCVFLAFMAYTTKVIADNCSSVESQLDGVKNDLMSLKDTSSHSGREFVTELRALNRSLLKLESTYEITHQQMELSMDGLVNRVGVLETSRQDGTPSNGVEQLYKEVVSLNISVRQLLDSSGDIMKAMDSITTAINSYDFQLRGLHRDHGDLSSNQATLGAAVEGIRGSLTDLQAEVNVVRDSALENNKVMHQTMERLALQLAQLEAAVGVLNQSLSQKPTTPPMVHHITSEVPLPSATIPPSQPTLKPNVPSFTSLPPPSTSTTSTSTSTTSTSTTSTSTSSPSLTASLSLHSQSLKMDMPPQPTPYSSVVITGSLTPVLTPLPQTPIPTTSTLGNTSSGTTHEMRNGTGTSIKASVVLQKAESESAVPGRSENVAATPSISEWESTFNMTDTDGNGKLDEKEFNSSFGDDGKAIFPMVDKNNDHYITRDELMNAFLENQLP